MTHNDDVTMMNLYRELWLTPRDLHHRIKPNFDRDNDPKAYDLALKNPESDDVIYDREDIEQETRETLADMTCEWWNWLSPQYVQRAQPGIHKGTEKFYLLKMTSVANEDAEGHIEVLQPDGEPEDLTRPTLEPFHRMITRKKSPDSRLAQKVKSKDKQKQIQIQSDNLDVDERFGATEKRTNKNRNKNPEVEEDKWETPEAKWMKEQIPQEEYTDKDSETEGFPGGKWDQTTTVDQKQKEYKDPKAFQSGWGDGGKRSRLFMKLLAEELAKDKKNAKGKAATSKGGKNGKEVKKTYPRAHVINRLPKDGKFEPEEADESEGDDRFNASEDTSEDIGGRGRGR